MLHRCGEGRCLVPGYGGITACNWHDSHRRRSSHPALLQWEQPIYDGDHRQHFCFYCRICHHQAGTSTSKVHIAWPRVFPILDFGTHDLSGCNHAKMKCVRSKPPTSGPPHRRQRTVAYLRAVLNVQVPLMIRRLATAAYKRADLSYCCKKRFSSYNTSSFGFY